MSLDTLKYLLKAAHKILCERQQAADFSNLHHRVRQSVSHRCYGFIFLDVAIALRPNAGSTHESGGLLQIHSGTDQKRIVQAQHAGRRTLSRRFWCGDPLAALIGGVGNGVRTA